MPDAKIVVAVGGYLEEEKNYRVGIEPSNNPGQIVHTEGHGIRRRAPLCTAPPCLVGDFC